MNIFETFIIGFFFGVVIGIAIGRNYPIRIHSQNPVGVANMRAIIERNGWREVR